MSNISRSQLRNIIRENIEIENRDSLSKFNLTKTNSRTRTLTEAKLNLLRERNHMIKQLSRAQILETRIENVRAKIIADQIINEGLFDSISSASKKIGQFFTGAKQALSANKSGLTGGLFDLEDKGMSVRDLKKMSITSVKEFDDVNDAIKRVESSKSKMKNVGVDELKTMILMPSESVSDKLFKELDLYITHIVSLDLYRDTLLSMKSIYDKSEDQEDWEKNRNIEYIQKANEVLARSNAILETVPKELEKILADLNTAQTEIKAMIDKNSEQIKSIINKMMSDVKSNPASTSSIASATKPSLSRPRTFGYNYSR